MKKTLSLIFVLALTFSFVSCAIFKNELVLHDLKAKYPATWFKTEIDSDAISLVKNSRKGRITFSYFKSDFYYDCDSVINEFISEYEELWDSFKTIGEVQDVTINGIEWKKIEFYGTLDGEDRKCIQWVYAADYEIYCITYISTEKSFDGYLNELNEIIASAYLPPKEANTDEIKQKVLGEWDCGDTGYLIINSDNTYYFYMDSSKDADNVIYGTYEVTNGIPTYAAGYEEGITFITTIKTFTVDGAEQEISEDAKIQYAFVPDGTGNYDGSNLNTGSYFTMKKMK